MTPIIIPVGKIYDLVSGNAYRRWQAEMALREAWERSSPAEKEEIREWAKASKEPGADRVRFLVAELAGRDRRRDREARQAQWLSRHRILRAVLIGFMVVGGPYFFVAPSFRAFYGLTRRAGVRLALLGIGGWAAGILYATIRY